MTDATDRDTAYDDAEEGGRDYRSQLEGYLESLLGEEAHGEFRDSRRGTTTPEYCALVASLAA
jgi:hypothetical protein